MFEKVFNNVMEEAQEHSSAICLVAGVIGMAGAVYLAVRGKAKADKKLEALKQEEYVPTKKEVIKAVWKDYVPSAIAFAASAGVLIYGYHTDQVKIGGLKDDIAALTGMYVTGQETIKAMKDENKKELGEEKAQEVHDNASKQVVNNYISGKEETIEIVDPNGELIIEGFSGRMYRGKKEMIQEAVNNINKYVLSNSSASINMYLRELKLEPMGTFADYMGFNTDNFLEVRLTSSTTASGELCWYIDPQTAPDFI